MLKTSCLRCGEPFEPRKASSKFCSRRCFIQPIEEILGSKIATPTTPDGCALWQGVKHRTGYGIVVVGSSRKKYRAHRLMWEFIHGPIPEGMVVRHKCNTPSCVRADHLEIGTQWDNVQDSIRDGRKPTGSRAKNATLTEEQVR